jgi:hypothetical protein
MDCAKESGLAFMHALTNGREQGGSDLTCHMNDASLDRLPAGDSDGRCVGAGETPQEEVVGSPIKKSLERFPPALAAGERDLECGGAKICLASLLTGDSESLLVGDSDGRCVGAGEPR